MKFIVSSSYLLKQVQVLGNVINSSNTLPILDNFLFEIDNRALTVSASDLETTMSATLEIESESQGSVAVPARLLLEILKTFPEQPLTFTVEDTGHFQNFKERSLGAVTLAAPQVHSLQIRAKTKAAAAVMDVRQVQLIPVTK